LTATAVCFAAGLVVVTYWPHLVAVWQTGAFFDTDDAMRLVQVRALIHGQSWFDMNVYPLDPPVGSFMHWSRVVDIPLVLLIKSFRLFTDMATAERLARLAFPLALLVALFAGVARLAAVLLGSVAQIPAIAATLLCGSATYQFQPGRIDHHAPQIVLLVFMVAAVLDALDPRLARRAAIAGALAAMSLAIGLENLPFIACLGAFLVAAWVWQGAAMAGALSWFSAGFGTGLMVFFALTVAPQRWFEPVCDSLGMAHLGAGLIGSIGWAAIALCGRALDSRARRCAAAIAVAAAAALFVATAYPACLHDPFAGVDPLVREIWIEHVTESLPFSEMWRQRRIMALLLLMPVLLGFAGAMAAALILRGGTGLRFLLLALLTAVGLAAAFWQVRVFASVTPLAICGALPLAVWLHDRLRRAGRDLLAILALCLVFPFTSAAWALALPDERVAAAGAGTCLTPAAFAPIAALPAGRVVAPIDAGPYLLAHTGMSVFAAPYHRNNDGNRFALSAFLAPPQQARVMLEARQADYVAICPGLPETSRLARRQPDSLAALIQGSPSLWLVQIPLTGTAFQLFRVARTPQAALLEKPDDILDERQRPSVVNIKPEPGHEDRVRRE
jgi:hypothetical protein